MTLEASKIRVMHVITGLNTGGAEMMLLKLLTAISGDFSHVVVSLMDEGTIGPRIMELSVPVHSLGLRPAAPNPIGAFSLRSLTRQFRPQLIQGWMYHGNLAASLAGVLSPARVPVLWNIRQSLQNVSSHGRRTAAIIRLGAFFSRHSAAIIYNSQTAAREHEAFGYRNRRQVVIPNGFDCQTFRPDDDARRHVRAELGLGSDTILVGLVARYHPMKDHTGFLRAAALVARAHHGVYFVLVGSGVTREQVRLSRVMAELQLQDRTFLLGERSDITRLTAALDIACSSSAWGEGFSNAIGEAMSCGVPCVVTDVGDSAYLVAESDLVVPPHNPPALAHAINHLIEAKQRQRQLFGEAARRRITNEFSLPAIVRRYEELYWQHLPLTQS